MFLTEGIENFVSFVNIEMLAQALYIYFYMQLLAKDVLLKSAKELSCILFME